MRLKDKVAIVTGGGQGIGKAIALAFAAEGASVVVAARNLANLQKTAEAIVSKGGKAKAIQTDVTKEADIERMVPSDLSPMPSGLLSTLERDEVLDLVAFIAAKGNPEGPAFRR